MHYGMHLLWEPGWVRRTIQGFPARVALSFYIFRHICLGLVGGLWFERHYFLFVCISNVKKCMNQYRVSPRIRRESACREYLLFRV